MYGLPPPVAVAVSVVLTPEQSDTGLDAVSKSGAPTVTVTFAVVVQPFASVTVIVYVVVAVGVTLTVVPLSAPGFHVTT